MTHFWPETFMDYINIIAAFGTILALSISVFLLKGTVKRINVVKISFEEVIKHNKQGKVTSNEYFVNLTINNVFPAEIEIIGLMVISIDKNLKSVIQKLFNESHILRPYYQSSILVKLQKDAQIKGYFPQKCYIRLMTKDHGSFHIKYDKKFLHDYNAFLNNLEISEIVEYVDAPGGEFYPTIKLPRSFKFYTFGIKLQNYFLKQIKKIHFLKRRKRSQ
ncbi:MAG: hypothetical protein IJ830_06825 [Alphaproteobacteria bacterium]|nr:hypothetical protein [Alphaproteobacteria bacterium]